jgi:hypothetical protein
MAMSHFWRGPSKLVERQSANCAEPLCDFLSGDAIKESSIVSSPALG